jgi:hypothetical protein
MVVLICLFLISNRKQTTTDEFGDDEDKKVQLLTGKRVTLAEELSKLKSDCGEVGIVEGDWD